MLNCTDLACVLHHHNFYAHLHQLKHHLQDDVDHTALGDGSNVDNNDNTQTNSNDTDSDLSSLSHVDAPNDVIYTVCGVVIAMLLVGLIIVLVAVTINKLRKREESSTATAVTAAAAAAATTTPSALEAQQQQQQMQLHSRSSSNNNSNRHLEQHQLYKTTTLSETINNNINNNNNNNNINNNNRHQDQEHQQQQQRQTHQVTFARISGIAPPAVQTQNTTTTTTTIANGNCNSVWVFPPKAPTPNIYNCMNNDMLLAATDKNGGGIKGLRKQFSGRFKRLVTKKPDPPSPIPPELKPQLKTIYVY